MKKRSLIAAALAVAGLTTSLISTSAYADNLSLRIKYQDQKGKINFEPVRAQVGKFGTSLPRPEYSEEALLWVVAKDKSGRVVYETNVRNQLKQRVEVFNPTSGQIDFAQDVQHPEGLLEVSIPFDANIARVEVHPRSQLLNQTLAGATAVPPLANFNRTDLEKLLFKNLGAEAATAAAAAKATTIVETGAAKDRMDFVFVGDGYTAAEMTKWQNDAKSVIAAFQSDPLLAKYKGKINIRRVDIASNQSGVDEPDKGIYKDTAMDGAFNCANIERLLCVNTTKVFNVVGSVLAPDARDIIIVISNSTRYGGSGGQVAAMSMNSSSKEVALHEIGHTAFALADEYDYGTCANSREPSEGNVSIKGNRSVKWGSLIAANTAVPTTTGKYPNGTVGVFEGGKYCTRGMYRPTENSRMRQLGYPWHAVNEGLAAKVFAKFPG